MRSAIWFYAVAVGVVWLDQLTKVVVRMTLRYGREVTVIPGFFDLRLSYNRGAAFGILPDWAPLFIVIALVTVFVIVRLRRTASGSSGLSIGLGLIVGGAAGNLVDRLLSPTREVTDFISLHIALGGKTHVWPTFNIADIAIVMGAFLVFLYVFTIERRVPNS